MKLGAQRLIFMRWMLSTLVAAYLASVAMDELISSRNNSRGLAGCVAGTSRRRNKQKIAEYFHGRLLSCLPGVD